MPALEDRSQIGLSEQAVEDREYIKDVLGLRDLQDAYRLAVAAALAKNLPPASENVRRTTAYGAAVLDASGALRASVLALREDHGGRPYALIERLAEAGLQDLASHLREGLPIRQYLLALVPPQEGPARAAEAGASL
jgi:hypothetical protein